MFIDGPLKGQEMFVDARTLRMGLQYEPPPARGSSSVRLPPRVLYHFTDVAMFGRTVLIGSVADVPGSEDAFQALASEEAKAAAGT